MPKSRTRDYESDSIVVRFEPRRCIHAAECVHGHPQVFDPERRPWVDPSRGQADEIARVVLRCPTGALTFERLDGGDGEPRPGSNEVRVAPNGPLYLRGRLRIELGDDETLEATRAALCRCGATSNPPFCDGSHVEAGFEDGGALGAAMLGAAKDEEAAALEIRCAPNGPLLVNGPLTLRAAQGDDVHEGGKGALCRCGASRARPYCDGSHVDAGFTG